MYVVTGGAGFIGSNVVAALSDRGLEVVVCDWLRSDNRWRNLAKHEIADVIVPEGLLPWLGQHTHEIDAIIHMGANSSTTDPDIELVFKQNTRATLDLLQWCTEHDKRLIYASSAATYGNGTAGFDDDGNCEALTKLRPLNAYGWSKHVVDRRIARKRQMQLPLPPQCTGLKFFNVYGPNEYHKGTMRSVVAKGAEGFKRGEPMRLFRSHRSDYTDGGQLRDFVYVRDCVDVILWLLENPKVSGLFNVGSGKARSWLDLANALYASHKQQPDIQFIDMPNELKENYQYFTEAKMERLKAAGYDKPFTTLEAGIDDYVSGYLLRADPYR
jgi:ADP-L-glycero-D-manno-heptose 6-epimerase